MREALTLHDHHRHCHTRTHLVKIPLHQPPTRICSLVKTRSDFSRTHLVLTSDDADITQAVVGNVAAHDFPPILGADVLVSECNMKPFVKDGGVE